MKDAQWLGFQLLKIWALENPKQNLSAACSKPVNQKKPQFSLLTHHGNPHTKTEKFSPKQETDQDGKEPEDSGLIIES